MNKNIKKPNMDLKTLIDFLKSLWINYKLQLTVVIIAIIGCSLSSTIGTLFLQSLIDDYIIPLTKSTLKDFTPLAHMLFKMAVVYIIGIVCSYLYNRIMVTVSQGTIMKIRKKLFSHMQSLPLSYFDTHAHGDIMSIYTNDTDTLRQFISQSLPQLFNSIITVLSIFISMIILNIPLTLITLFMICIMFLIAKNITKKSSIYFKQQQDNLGKLDGFIEEMIGGQKVIKVFCYEKRSIKRFKKVNENLRVSSKKANTYGNILMPIITQIGNVSYVLCAFIGAMFALNGYSSITIRILVSFLTLNKNLNQPLSQISQQAGSIVMAIAGIKRINELLEEEKEQDEGFVNLVNIKYEGGKIVKTKSHTNKWGWECKEKNKEIFKELKGNISFNNVDFGYEDKNTILHNINLDAKSGEKIALVGSTGAKKTTITNLINRFYDISKGNIYYDGINIKDIKKKSLRRSLAMVLQDTNLFSGTIMYNIRYGRLDTTDEECIKAAKLANADTFIKMLPEGYNTFITAQGGMLSQGQKQLLAIARAAVANPLVLILDEATSSIDTNTEKLVQDGMDKLMKGRTTFVIAHRLSTIKNANKILVLENGRIIEQGDHKQLLETKGKYYQLYTGKNLAIN
ncbi:ABC transporter ATP-binding protein [Anaerofustis butyriciformans]|uniref:ABC transporter ATP-binding protein n=1 Tax=Anaerofustis butyriciformans TaxID=3108533 RepID=UPI003F8A3857